MLANNKGGQAMKEIKRTEQETEVINKAKATSYTREPASKDTMYTQSKDTTTNNPPRQELRMLNRNVIEVIGLKNVDSFDSDEFMLDTHMGMLVIQGQNLHMKHLNVEKGLVVIEGDVRSISYSDGSVAAKKTKRLFGKLFK
jgi:sporulation protein YabP